LRTTKVAGAEAEAAEVAGRGAARTTKVAGAKAEAAEVAQSNTVVRQVRGNPNIDLMKTQLE